MIFTMKTITPKLLFSLPLAIMLLISAAVNGQLKADFSATPRTGCPPFVVNFKDSSFGTPTSWKWDLGNGTISFLQNPTTTYFDPGTYNVKLVVQNANGKDSTVKNQYIVVNSLPIPLFNVSDTVGCYPLKARFEDLSLPGSGVIKAWQWDFGDGTLATEANPIHPYTASGTFSVTLKVTNTFGCSKIITKNALIKTQNGVKAAFSYSSSQGCQTSAPVNFINQSTGNGSLQYWWNFGNSTGSSAVNPVVNYGATGSYTVRLIVSSSFGCRDTLTKANAINIGVVKANFNPPDTVCTGAPFQLTNASTPASFVGSTWTFGNDTILTQTNPIHSFETAGVHLVKLVTDFGSCRDSVTKSIVSIPKPNVSFNAPVRYSCKAPLTVNFNNTSSNAVSYLWNFGDGSTSTQKNPSHQYTTMGSYAVSLIIINSNGCTDTLLLEDYVRVSPPEILSIDSLMIKECTPYTVYPHATIATGLPISSYLWNFGDGGTSTDSTPAHTYTVPGNYNVKLTVSSGAGCIDTFTLVEAVMVGLKPTAIFSATPLDVCANTPVNFTDLSTVPNGYLVDWWYWEFGDGGTSPEKNPTHTYSDTGWFTVTLTVASLGCNDSALITNYVHVKPPIAKFDTSYSCSTPLKRNFIDSSIGASSWTWDFGDGGTSTQRNPAHTYAASGTYPVSLTVSDGSCQHTKIENVLVLDQSPRMIISDSINCRATRVLFDIGNVMPGSIQRYRWFFEGVNRPGAPTNNTPVAQSYSTTGVRTPAVALTDILQCVDTAYASFPITIYGPKAAFGGNPRGGCFGTTITFLDSTITDGIHPISSWTWNFGDGPSKVLTSGPFTHYYTSPGVYNVYMIVRDSYGCKDSVGKSSFVSISSINAGFNPSDSLVCPNSPITFSINSVGADVTYKWDFGDNNSSTSATPVHTFSNPGTYITSLVVADKIGCRDSSTKVIKVFSAKSKFALSDSFAICPPLVVNASNTSSNFKSYQWDFGDGSYSTLLNPSHIYTYPGTYTISLAVSNTGGCTDTMRKNIVINGPTGSFGYVPTRVCNPGSVSYNIISNNAISYIWDFSDGNTLYTTQNSTSHIYSSPGIYVPKVIIEDGGGCKVAILGLDTVKVIGIETTILSDVTSFCDSGYVSFRDSTITNDVVNSFMWNFGDGTFSNNQNPTHGYSTPGLYTITFIASTPFGCKDTAKLVDYIKVSATPRVRIIGDSVGCQPAQLAFAGALAVPDTSTLNWAWTFDNGNTFTGQAPPAQLFSNSGNFNIRLVATNVAGCGDTAMKRVVIHPKPVVDAGPDAIICKGQSHPLQATGANSFVWTSSPFLSCINCSDPSANPLTKNTFYVTGSNAAGCSGTDSVIVDVRQPFVMTVNNGDTVCVGQSVSIGASGADSYQWSPSLWLDNSSIANPQTKPDSTITYTVVGEDNARCFKDTGYIKVKVYPIPTIEITNGNNISLQIGKTVKLSTKASTDVTSFSWTPGQALSCITCAEPITSTRDNITYTVKATNDGNCSSQDNVTISMICENSNVFIPNTFSPNNDGMNDAFYPRGSGVGNVRSMRIFNRWGQMVYQKINFPANDASEGWNGKFNGVDMQADVYVYIVEVVCANNQVLPLKGNITLLR